MFWAIVSAFRMNAQHQQPESAQLTLNMAANAQETLPVDELEDILCLIEEGFLEDDDELNKQIEGITLEVSLDEDNHSGFKCSLCEKVCKSRRGLRSLPQLLQKTRFPLPLHLMIFVVKSFIRSNLNRSF